MSGTKDNMYVRNHLQKVVGFPDTRFQYCKAGFPAKCSESAYTKSCIGWCEVAGKREPSECESDWKDQCLSSDGSAVRRECPTTCMLELSEKAARSIAFDRFLNTIRDLSHEYNWELTLAGTPERSETHPITLTSLWQGDAASERMIDNADSIASFVVVEGSHTGTQMYSYEFRDIDTTFQLGRPLSDAKIAQTLQFN